MSNNIKYYQNQIIDMFYLSVDNNIDKWTCAKDNELDMYSESFSKYKINLDTKRKKLYLKNDSKSRFTYICTYKIGIIPINFKMNKYANKLKKYLKAKDDINSIKDRLKVMSQTYIKEIRKEKLTKMEN